MDLRHLIPHAIIGQTLYPTQQKAYLIHLHILEYLSHKLIRRPVPQSPTKSTHAQADEQHVAKVKGSLHQPMHTRLEDKVVNGVKEDVQCRRSARVECRPLPKVVFRVEAEVHHNDGGHAHHQTKDGIHPEKESIDMIKLVIPQGGQNVIKFNEDGSKREKPRKGNEVGRNTIPRSILRDGTWNGIHTTGEGITLFSTKFRMTSQQGSKDAKGNRYKDPQKEELQQHQKWNVVNGSIEKGNAIENRQNRPKNGRK
mmetsp:Transcript_8546/g.14988  ORF Transcript_8546/g.14988 Transcript_8546/m.14988 type:complete len:255 (+) Transcript_8546:111-875(+)